MLLEGSWEGEKPKGFPTECEKLAIDKIALQRKFREEKEKERARKERAKIDNLIIARAAHLLKKDDE